MVVEDDMCPLSIYLYRELRGERSISLSAKRQKTFLPKEGGPMAPLVVRQEAGRGSIQLDIENSIDFSIEFSVAFPPPTHTVKLNINLIRIFNRVFNIQLN